MTIDHRKVSAQIAQGILLDDPGFLREIVERVLQEMLEAEMTHHIGAAPYERRVLLAPATATATSRGP
jgi:transposase-like protein